MALLVVTASVFLVFVVDTVWRNRRGREASRGPLVIAGALLGFVLLSIPASHLYWRHYVNEEGATLRPVIESRSCASKDLNTRITQLYRRCKWARYFAGTGPLPDFGTFPGFLGPFTLWVPSDVASSI
jgi:hypothetical protein